MEIKQRKSFVVYDSWIEILEELEPTQHCTLFLSMAKYALYDEEPKFADKLLSILWKSLKPQIDANKRKYENGCKGGAPKGSRNNPNGRRGKQTNQELTENNQGLTQTNQNLANVNVNDNVNVNVSSLSLYKETKEDCNNNMQQQTNTESVCLKTTDSGTQQTNNNGATTHQGELCEIEDLPLRVTEEFRRLNVPDPEKEAAKFIAFNEKSNWAVVRQGKARVGELVMKWADHIKEGKTNGTAAAAISSPSRVNMQTDEPMVDGMTRAQFYVFYKQMIDEGWDGYFLYNRIFFTIGKPTPDEIFDHFVNSKNSYWTVRNCIAQEMARVRREKEEDAERKKQQEGEPDF